MMFNIYLLDSAVTRQEEGTTGSMEPLKMLAVPETDITTWGKQLSILLRDYTLSATFSCYQLFPKGHRAFQVCNMKHFK